MKNNKVMKIVLGLIVVLCCIGLCVMFSKKSTENQTTMNDGSDVLVADESVEESLDIAIDPAYKLVWEDNFDGAELNRDDWNVELHAPGWVNAEWQEYVDSEDNIYLKDGNLVIQPIKMKLNHKDYYTSGRINTQNKHDFTYGRFEARCKVPNGKGFLPAFWMMPTDESFYGQWPKCGEIDIMEVLGDDVTTAHGTLHFGEPHSQKQGTHKLAEGNYADEFHVFACEWEPGEIRFYVDNELYYTENDWFTRRKGFDDATYPAPFDQPFYMILNVAVGGSWVGYPDVTTEFGDNAQMVVDYVRVYQKDEYDTNVSKPVKEVVAREADTTGNFVINSAFAENEDLLDSEDWSFLLFHSGEATANIADGEIHIVTENSGTEEYSVQLVQPNIPLEKGGQYKLSFEAYADEDRKMITNISAPDLNYIRYYDDQKVELTTSPQVYEFEFTMKENSDTNGRVEFNMGAQGSKATVHITNVRVEKMGQSEVGSGVESYVLPDGNYIYNSTFDRGENRLGYWEVSNNCDGASVEVTNSELERELMVTVPDTVATQDEIVLKQPSIRVEGGKTYKLLISAYAKENKNISVNIADNVFEIPVTTEKQQYCYEVKTNSDDKDVALEILLGSSGTTYLDNIYMYEANKTMNGNFTNDVTGYEFYIDNTANATYAVDELTEGGALGFTINNIADRDDSIQLVQKNLRLEKGKTYTIQFDGKTDLNRDVKIEVKKDGEDISYSGEAIHGLSRGYRTYSHTFTMEEETDNNAVVVLYLGKINDNTTKKTHVVYLDNINLLEE